MKRAWSCAAVAVVASLLSVSFGAASASAATPAWSQLNSTTLSERQNARVAFDATTSRLFLFGGDNSVGVLSDTWVFRGSRWQRLLPTVNPPPRTGGVFVYDPDTGTVILFGGDTHTAPNGILNDTWSFDGRHWTQLQPAHQPPPRSDASATYDPIDHEIVVYGGLGNDGFLGDTWTFDGNDWTQQTTAIAPAPRYGAAMAFDTTTSAAILFGGLGTPPAGTSSPYLGDTWAYANHQWTQLTPATSPSGRWDAALAAGAGSMLTLFGGYADSGLPHSPGTVYGDTWTWNGSTWLQSPASGPPSRYATAMAADPALHAAVLVGGCCNAPGGFYTDTWSFDGTSWTAHTRADAPSVRIGAVMTADPDRGDAVLFGGFGGDGFLGDTWTEKAGSWSQLHPATAPAGRFAASIAYDTVRMVTVLFGGQSAPSSGCSTTPDALNPNHLCNDTWTFDGSSWTRQPAPTSPPYRSLGAMAFDGATGNTVLYGGFSDQNTLGDTWTWNGVTWMQQSPGTSPPPLDGAAMAWDAQHHQLILFGGEGNGANGPQYFNQTWRWTGSTWKQLHPASSPPPLYAATMTYDPSLGGLVLSTGQGGGPGVFGTYGATWLWNGTTWSVLSLRPHPAPRYFAAAAYDSTLGSVVLFGGGGGDGFRDDTWHLMS